MMISLVAALVLAAAPKPEYPVRLPEAVCVAANAKASGEVLILSPSHAFVKDEEGNLIELYGSFVCFRVAPAPADSAPGQKL